MQTRVGLPSRNFRDYTSKMTSGSPTNCCDLILAKARSHYPLTITNADLRLQPSLRILKSCHSFRKKPQGRGSKGMFVSRKTGKEIEGQLLAEQVFVMYSGTRTCAQVSVCSDRSKINE